MLLQANRFISIDGKNVQSFEIILLVHVTLEQMYIQYGCTNGYCV
jgi:hypothetical protein